MWKSARSALAALFVSLLIASASACPSYSCPTGYTVIPDTYPGSSSCGYSCATAYKPQCLGSLGQSKICGGTTGVRCPTVACTTSFAAAFSGPNGACLLVLSSVQRFYSADQFSSLVFAGQVAQAC